MCGDISTPMTLFIKRVSRDNYDGDIVATDLAVWVSLRNVHGPRSGAITTVEDSSETRNRRKDKPVVKDPVENLVLGLETFCFFLNR